jgi:hypothetical protein
VGDNVVSSGLAVSRSFTEHPVMAHFLQMVMLLIHDWPGYSVGKLFQIYGSGGRAGGWQNLFKLVLEFLTGFIVIHRLLENQATASEPEEQQNKFNEGLK